jgi:hypothetical protein
MGKKQTFRARFPNEKISSEKEKLKKKHGEVKVEGKKECGVCRKEILKY